MNKAFTILFIIVSFFYAQAQETWKLERDKLGVKVFTKKVAKSGMKDSKAELIVKGSPDEVIKELRNVANHKTWMHRIGESTLHKKVNDNEYYAYYVAKAPWPVADRDIVIQYNIKKEKNGNYIVTCVGKPNEIAVKENRVRIPRTNSTWEIVALKEGSTKIIYTSSADAGGNIPDWLANSSATDTPYETVAALKVIVEK